MTMLAGRHTYWSRSNPCELCGGGEAMERDRAQRCHGGTGEDGWIRCKRLRCPRSDKQDATGTWPHPPGCPCRTGASAQAVPSQYPNREPRKRWRDPLDMGAAAGVEPRVLEAT